jgi:type IV pilus assembly protein PilX
MMNCKRSYERGATLVIALIMLLLMSIMSLSAMQGTTMQERMVGNMRDSHMGFYSGEIALDYAESWIRDQSTKPAFEIYPCTADCGGKVYDAVNHTSSVVADLESGDADWNTSITTYADNALDGAAASVIADVSAQPEMTLEWAAFEKDSLEPDDISGDYRFRSTIRSFGGSSTSEVLMQTEYVKRFD